jgi:hypothetical protein
LKRDDSRVDQKAYSGLLRNYIAFSYAIIGLLVRAGIRNAIEPVGDTRADRRIVREIAKRLNGEQWSQTNAPGHGVYDFSREKAR